jgi:tRNA(Ile)-lysidine synthase
MIHLIGQTKHLTAVACSGGADSMAALSFLSRGNQQIKAVYFHHGTQHGEEALLFLQEYCAAKSIQLLVGRISSQKSKDVSWEEYWRDQRYGFLTSLHEQLATAHHLNDAAESYVMGFIRGGNPRMIPYHRPPNIYRPFLLTPRKEMESWCQRHDVPWIEDPSNQDTHYDRNRIRHKILPEMLAMNPGLLGQVAKKIKAAINITSILC